MLRKAGWAWVLLIATWPCFSQEVFTSVDIGVTSPSGKTVVATNGFNLTSATGDIWGSQDNFRFAYQTIAGDFDFRAQIQGFTAAAYWSKAGLMVRSSLDDYAQNGMMVATPTTGWDRYMFTARVADFYPSYVYFQGSYERVEYPNAWLRLVRVGNAIIAMHSTNGISWTQIGNLDFVTWPATVLVGAAVSNHPDSGTIPATAQFRNLVLSHGVPQAPAILTQPASQAVNPGATSTFSVTAVGSGLLNYQWYRDGNLVPGATNAALSLQAGQAGEEAKFTCHLWNEAGDLWSWAGQLEVVNAAEPFDGILSELYYGVYGRLTEYLINSTNFPQHPSLTSHPGFFDVPSFGDDVGGRLRGYVTPPITGDYTFYIAADDRGELWVSQDDNPAHKQMIASCYYWVNFGQWEYYPSQVANPVRLTAGKRYYVEALFKGEGSPNHCEVGWRLPDGSYERPLPAKRFQGAAPALGFAYGAGGNPAVTVNGTTDTLYVVETSTDLSTWTPLLTNRAPFNFVGSAAGGDIHFYRARTSK